MPEGDKEGRSGTDDKLRDFLFRERGEDPLGQMTNLKAGMMSIGIGMVAYVSMAEMRQVELSKFLAEWK